MDPRDLGVLHRLSERARDFTWLGDEPTGAGANSNPNGEDAGASVMEYLLPPLTGKQQSPADGLA